MSDLQDKRICVTGSRGFLGRQVVRRLESRGFSRDQLILPRREEYDLTREADVQKMYEMTEPDVVIHLAAEVGGIGANREHPGRFFYTNLAMGLHLIEHARRHRISKFVQVGTICSYPKHCPVPFREDSLWEGYPEETNAPYGLAKKSLLVMLDAYHREYGLKSAMLLPVNLYGPADNFDPRSSHVIPALLLKCEDARIRRLPAMTCWGTGRATREFLYVEDAAEGVVRAAERIDVPVPINLGTGREISIFELAHLIARTTGFDGRIEWDPTMPDGQPRRCVDIARATQMLEWRPRTTLEEGMRATINWYREMSATSQDVA